VVNLSTVSKGKEFENQVAELYRLMGYEVKQNVGILGHQIDIVLTYTMPGGTKTKTAVECKYIEKGNLRKNDVLENLLALKDLKRDYKVQQLIIVTTTGFAKDVWDTAEADDIQLLTFCELQHQIVNFNQYLDYLTKNFESDELSEYYIDLIAQNDEKMPSEIFDPIDAYVTKWINNDTKNHLSILGEYGTGKTTFCRKFAHDLAVQYSGDPLNNRIPILINLRDYSKVMSVRQLITDLLINEYGFQGINFSLFEKMNEDGLFLLIFDGFDEMAQKVIFDVAYSNFSKIAELAKPKKSKVMLTCRTEFFRTHEQEKEILLDIDKRENFGIIYLREFDDEQIKKFLQKRVPLLEKQRKEKGWEYYYHEIQEVFDLKDLAKRPVLLELIVKYLPQLVKRGERINASTLYDTTIHEEIKRRLKVGKTVIKRDDRLKLMKLLAAWMYNNDKLSLYYENIPELLDLKVHFDLKTRTDIEYHLNDFLTCSFLNRDTEGNYRFSHKSFVDFLVACKFKDDIEKDYKNDFIKKTITYEVMQFMKDFDVNKDKLYEWIESTKNRSFSETRCLGGNAVSILNEFGENFSRKKSDFSETVLDYGNFRGNNLRGLNFRNSSLEYANLSNTNLVNTDFSFANLKGITLGEMEDISCVCWSPDGKYLASGSGGGTLKLWSKENFDEFNASRCHASSVHDIVYSPDGKYLASGSGDNTVKIWDMNAFKAIATLKGHTMAVYSITYSPDGKYLASGSRDNTVKIWDMNAFKVIATLKGHLRSVFCVAYNPDGKYLVSGSSDTMIRVWEMNTFKEIDILSGHAANIEALAYSPDGKYLASGSRDETIKIWDMNAFKVIATLEGHTDVVSSITYSPDGKYLASGSRDNTVKIWDMNAFKVIATLEGHTDVVSSVTYSPDGKYLASGSRDKIIKIWNANLKSNEFGKCQRTIKQQINCKGMNLRGVRGLDSRKIHFLKSWGAKD